MAERVNVSPSVLRSNVIETVEELQKLGRGTRGNIKIGYVKFYINRPLYLFDSVGVLGLYSFQNRRVPTPALSINTGGVLIQLQKEFSFLWKHRTQLEY